MMVQFQARLFIAVLLLVLIIPPQGHAGFFGFGSSDKDKAEEPSVEGEDSTEEPSAGEEKKHTGVFWQKPDFGGQTQSLGWTPRVFEAPPGFTERVKFWIDIYTKYTTTQALLHDSRYLDITYKLIDFSDIEINTKLTEREKSKARRARVKDEKNKVKEMLVRLEKFKGEPEKLTPEERALAEKFKFVDEKHKFREAGSRKRLRMQLGQKDRFILGIYYSGRYIREMEKIFREEGLPIELTRLPFVESSFNLYARSRVGASGIWQFMRSTGKLYMKIDSVTDERNDPLKATRAAARLLKFNYNLLGNWALALTAYNHGPRGVQKIVQNMKTDDINEIVWNTTGRRFGFASENFFAEFLAALHVESRAKEYFGKVEVSPQLVYEEVVLPKAFAFNQLLQLFRNPKDEDGEETARLYNPYFATAVLRGGRAVPAGYKVRVPKGDSAKVAELLQRPEMLKAEVRALDKSGFYKILPGDTLSGISQELGVPVRALLEANNIDNNTVLRPGRKLTVPQGDTR